MLNFKEKCFSMSKRIFTLCLSILLFLPVNTVLAASETGAKTDPPPIEIGIMGVFDPNHIYLNDGYTYINNLGDGQIVVNGRTTGKRYVDLLGVKITLQRWTGTAWINIYTSPSYTDSNTILLEVNIYRTVEKGYYYRVISTHWAEHGTVFEQGVQTGNSYLVN